MRANLLLVAMLLAAGVGAVLYLAPGDESPAPGRPAGTARGRGPDAQPEPAPRTAPAPGDGRDPRAATPSPPAAAPPAAEAPSLGEGKGRLGAREVARLLRLDAARGDALEAQLRQAIEEIKALEAAHAEMSRSGADTTFRITPYATQAAPTLDRWRLWLERNLTREERAAYERGEGERRLFGYRDGAYERTLWIRVSSAGMSADEFITTPDGPRPIDHVESNARVGETYGHLLSARSPR